MATSARNPFEYGRELLPEELVDREEELQTITSVIRNRGKLFLIGPRRFGKTSLLAAAELAIQREGGSVLRIDAERYETLELLSRALLTHAARTVPGPVERIVTLISEVASRLRPQVSFDPITGSVSIGLDASRQGEVTVLGDALDAVEALAERTGREVAVIIDEVQQIVVEHGIAAERQLRATVQRHRHVGYVFAGSSTRLLTAMTSDANRPFYRLGARLFLGEIPREAFRAFLTRGFRGGGMNPNAQATEVILDLAEDVPYNVQRLAHEVWEMLRARGVGELAEESVQEALARTLSREDPAYTQLWTSLTLNQKKALKAVIVTGGVGLTGEAARSRDMAPSSMHSALKGLEERHIVRLDTRQGATRHRLVDPFFARWLNAAQAL